ncbi:MAG: CDP-6-deoxy-delta-3,4-glucoseen reductase [Betaproteobacteria bacterium]|nr:CDP-6-deoxy-delta-3,4-glucoseen reductase [Betaproteobacteria bacterium]
MSFTVLVQPSGRQFTVEDGQTILQAAIVAGVGLPYSCKDGACSTCKCKRVSGIIELGPHQTKALSQQDWDAGYTLTCVGYAKSDLVIENKHVSAEGTYPVQKMPCRVASLTHAAPDVAIVTLQLPANIKLQYHAGQYVEFILRDSARRSYSMANAPGSSEQLELHIRHMPGGKFTDHVFGAMKEKEILRMEGPFGSFWLREDSDKPIVLLASGTGFAPIKAMLEHAQARGNTRPMTLYWGGRCPHDLYMHDWCEARAAALPWLRYVPVVSDALPEDAWAGRTGFVHRAVMSDLPDLSGYQVYACGAPIVVDSARRDFTAQCGLPEDEFYADSFTSEADKHGG